MKVDQQPVFVCGPSTIYNGKMLKFLITWMVWGAVGLPIFAAGADFRKASWGMSKSQVRAVETAKQVSSSGGMISYSGKLGEYSAKITYSFFQSKRLQEGIYVFEVRGNHDKLRTEFRRLLTKKYGNPRPRTGTGSLDDTYSDVWFVGYTEIRLQSTNYLGRFFLDQNRTKPKHERTVWDKLTGQNKEPTYLEKLKTSNEERELYKKGLELRYKIRAIPDSWRAEKDNRILKDL